MSKTQAKSVAADTTDPGRSGGQRAAKKNAGSSGARLIKRYANRKMYDTERSCYITLEEVADMVRAGQEVRVIDNKTKQDLTEVTLTQALLHSERKKRGSVSLDSLRSLLSQGGELIQSRVTEPVARAASEAERTVEKWRSEAERQVGRVLSKKEAEDAAKEAAESSQEAPAVVADVVQTEAESEDLSEEKKARRPVFVEQTQRAYDELQHRIDDRVKLLVSALTTSPANDEHVRALGDRLGQLEATVEALQARVAELEGAASK